ncbi:hypothetical protein K1719_014719 [Acacia pycnantha]|nr:hypothetical protein K1719_014719 [Acacia pycnantha]
MESRETCNPRPLFEKFNREPSFSATPPKVTGNNLEGDLRPKQSTIVSAFERAKRVQANLSNEFPSLIKSMCKSNVSKPFWLHLSKDFCEMHLPRDNTMMVLEDEIGREYETRYLPRKVALSGGWRSFSVAHKLIEGDVLVFHLIEPRKFKVYIIRSRESNEVDVAHDHLHLDGFMTQHDSFVPQQNIPSNSTMIRDAGIPATHQPENTRDLDQNVGSDVLNGIRSEPSISFQQVMGIENFSIVINGMVLDSQLSKHLKTKYYELCCSQKMFLHEQLEGQNCELVTGMICEMVNIADAIRASKITTSSDIFASWYNSLKGLEILGMNVSFLLARLEKLKSLASRFKRYKETRIERDRVEEQKKMLELKLVEVKETTRRFNVELESLNLESSDLEARFQDLANAL